MGFSKLAILQHENKKCHARMLCYRIARNTVGQFSGCSKQLPLVLIRHCITNVAVPLTINFLVILRKTLRKKSLWTVHPEYVIWTPRFNSYIRHDLIAVACETTPKKVETIPTRCNTRSVSLIFSVSTKFVAVACELFLCALTGLRSVVEHCKCCYLSAEDQLGGETTDLSCELSALGYMSHLLSETDWPAAI